MLSDGQVPRPSRKLPDRRGTGMCCYFSSRALKMAVAAVHRL
jgi:hypothetical protein